MASNKQNSGLQPGSPQRLQQSAAIDQVYKVIL